MDLTDCSLSLGTVQWLYSKGSTVGRCCFLGNRREKVSVWKEAVTHDPCLHSTSILCSIAFMFELTSQRRNCCLKRYFTQSLLSIEQSAFVGLKGDCRKFGQLEFMFVTTVKYWDVHRNFSNHFTIHVYALHLYAQYVTKTHIPVYVKAPASCWLRPLFSIKDETTKVYKSLDIIKEKVQ